MPADFEPRGEVRLLAQVCAEALGANRVARAIGVDGALGDVTLGDATSLLQDFLSGEEDSLLERLASVFGRVDLRMILSARGVRVPRGLGERELSRALLRHMGLRPEPTARPWQIYRDLGEMLRQSLNESDRLRLPDIALPELIRLLRFMTWFYLHGVRAHPLQPADGEDPGPTAPDIALLVESMELDELAAAMGELADVPVNPFGSANSILRALVLSDSEQQIIRGIAELQTRGLLANFRHLLRGLFADWEERCPPLRRDHPPSLVPMGAALTRRAQGAGEPELLTLADEEGDVWRARVSEQPPPGASDSGSTLLPAPLAHELDAKALPFLPDGAPWSNDREFHVEAAQRSRVAAKPAGASRKVFISYHRKQASLMVEKLGSHLEASGRFDVFIDTHTLRSGPITQEIRKQIRTRSKFVVVLAPDCFERLVKHADWVRLELEEAIQAKKSIVPVLIGGASYDHPRVREALSLLPSDLQVLSDLNSVGIPVEPYLFEGALDRLIELLEDG